MTVRYGFNAVMTAKPGRGGELVELLLTGLEEGNPASTEYCLVYLVCRSAAEPDVVHITEGWTSEDDHHRIFASPSAQAIVAKVTDLVAATAPYTDYVPVGGKAVL